MTSQSSLLKPFFMEVVKGSVKATEVSVPPSAFQFSTELDMELSAPDAEVSAQIDPIDLELRGDLEEGLFYFSSDALTQMSDPSVTGLWFKMDLKSMMDQLSLQTGLDLRLHDHS